MQKFQYILAKFPFSCIIIAGIWVLCFMNIPDTPLSNIRLIDKWTHAVMYLVLGFSLIFVQAADAVETGSISLLIALVLR